MQNVIHMALFLACGLSIHAAAPTGFEPIFNDHNLRPAKISPEILAAERAKLKAIIERRKQAGKK